MTRFLDEPVEAVLFDLGGTCLEIAHEVVAAAIRGQGHEPAPRWIRDGERAGRKAMETALREGQSKDRVWRAFFDGMIAATGARPAIHDGVFAEIAAYNRAHHLWNQVMPGIPEALGSLAARGYRVAAISNSDGRAGDLLERLGLLAAFEFVVDSKDVGVEKPDPRIFHLACDQLGLPPALCAYVGDVIAFDVEGAQAAGLKAILFDAYGSYDGHRLTVPRATTAGELLTMFPERAA